jgi:hypothetical protein
MSIWAMRRWWCRLAWRLGVTPSELGEMAVVDVLAMVGAMREKAP